VITGLFLVSGLFLRIRRTTDLAALGGLYRTQPAVAALAMIPLFSLAGVPPDAAFDGPLLGGSLLEAGSGGHTDGRDRTRSPGPHPRPRHPDPRTDRRRRARVRAVSARRGTTPPSGRVHSRGSGKMTLL